MKVKYIIFLVILGTAFSCKKKDDPKPPEASLLVFPLKDSECTTGEDINSTTSRVEFVWQEANHTETYELKVVNLNTGIQQNVTTTSTTAKLPLERGQPFSWTVISKNTERPNEQGTSETWYFYNAGFNTTYAPFPASIEEPGSGETILRDINNEITLSWSASDLDNDISGFDLYFGTTENPELLESMMPSSTTNYAISVTTDTVYYWRIVTHDQERNTSDSGIYTFRVR